MLTIPIDVWDSQVWTGMEKSLRKHGAISQADNCVAFATTNRLGIASIAMSRRAWRNMNPKNRGWIITHELFHLLRNRGGLRGRREHKEEALVERIQPKKSLVARTLSDGRVLLVNRSS